MWILIGSVFTDDLRESTESLSEFVACYLLRQHMGMGQNMSKPAMFPYFVEKSHPLISYDLGHLEGRRM